MTSNYEAVKEVGKDIYNFGKGVINGALILPTWLVKNEHPEWEETLYSSAEGAGVCVGLAGMLVGSVSSLLTDKPYPLLVFLATNTTSGVCEYVKRKKEKAEERREDDQRSRSLEQRTAEINPEESPTPQSVHVQQTQVVETQNESSAQTSEKENQEPYRLESKLGKGYGFLELD
jgi:hypothetical protein